MARFTGDMITALTTTNVRAEYILDVDFDSEPFQIWTGVQDVIIGTSTYSAAGTFQGISSLEETSELRAVGAQVSISGIPAAYITLALTESFRNRYMTLKLACVHSSDNSIVSDPITLFKGKMDVPTIMEQEDTAIMSISAESKLIDLTRVKRLLFTHEDQQLVSSGDDALEYVSELANIEMTWGI